MGNLSFREVLGKVKVYRDPKDLGGNVSQIRSTHKGNLMLGLKKYRLDKLDGIHTQAKNSLEDNVIVSTQKHAIYIECWIST